MARYVILENKEREGQDKRTQVYPGPDDPQLDNLDEAKTRLSEIRAKAKKSKEKYEDGSPVEYVVVRVKDIEEGKAGKNGAGTGATSVRLMEPTRQRLAKIVGYRMWKTGQTVSLGDAIDELLDFHEKWADRVNELEGAEA